MPQRRPAWRRRAMIRGFSCAALIGAVRPDLYKSTGIVANRESSISLVAVRGTSANDATADSQNASVYRAVAVGEH